MKILKTFKQHIKEDTRRLTPDQTRDALIRSLGGTIPPKNTKEYSDVASANKRSRDEMDAMLNAPIAMGLEEKLDEFLSEKGITKGQVRSEMAEKLASIISNHRTATRAEKLDFVEELRKGNVYDVKAMIDDALKDRTNIYQSKYRTSTNSVAKNGFFAKEFWEWEPQYDKRNVGGGETLMILCDPDGKKGGEGAGGDANLGPGYMIELKKSVSDRALEKHKSAASFGDKGTFSAAKRTFKDAMKQAYEDFGLDEPDLDNCFLPDNQTSIDGKLISLALNKAAALCRAVEFTVMEVRVLFNDVCRAAHGTLIETMENVITDKRTHYEVDHNAFMKVWIANAMSAYQNKSPSFDVLFYFDALTGYATAFSSAEHFIRKSKYVDIDWVLNWKQGGYGHATPRLIARPWTEKPITRDPLVFKIDYSVNMLRALSVFVEGLPKRRATSFAPYWTKGNQKIFAHQYLSIPDSIMNVPGYLNIKTQEDADRYKVIIKYLAKAYTTLKTITADTGLKLPKETLRDILQLVKHIQSGIRGAGFRT